MIAFAVIKLNQKNFRSREPGAEKTFSRELKHPFSEDSSPFCKRNGTFLGSRKERYLSELS